MTKPVKCRGERVAKQGCRLQHADLKASERQMAKAPVASPSALETVNEKLKSFLHFRRVIEHTPYDSLSSCVAFQVTSSSAIGSCRFSA